MLLSQNALKNVYFRSIITIKWYTIYPRAQKKCECGKEAGKENMGKSGRSVEMDSACALWVHQPLKTNWARRYQQKGTSVSTVQGGTEGRRYQQKGTATLAFTLIQCFSETHSWRSLRRRWGGEPDTIMMIGKPRNQGTLMLALDAKFHSAFWNFIT